MRVNLTAKSLAALKPGPNRTEYFDSNLPGFAVRVSPAGVKTFVAMYRHNGRLRRLTIGTYPPLTLADARDKAREALRSAQLGSDPAAEKIAERQAGTFEELALAYLERWAKKRKRSWKADERIINRYLLPRWRHSKPGDISRAEVRVMLEAMAESAPTMANRTLACLRKIFNWGLSQDLVESNPCTAVAQPGVEQRRDRVLSEEEIRKVWAAMEAESHADMGALYRLRLLTAQRGGELATMRWQDIDFDTATWTIPADRAKNGIAHRVPLSDPSVKILTKLQRHRKLESKRRQVSPWVFPSRRRPEEPVEELQKAHQRIRDAASVADYRAHDLRRTAASQIASLGTSRLVLSKILNHSENSSVTSIYDKFGYDREKREALEAWARQLMRIAKGLTAVDHAQSLSPRSPLV